MFAGYPRASGPPSLQCLQGPQEGVEEGVEEVEVVEEKQEKEVLWRIMLPMITKQKEIKKRRLMGVIFTGPW